MEEGVGFEPTERSSRSSVFKTDALNQSLPTFHMAQVERIEHSYTVLETAVLPLNYTCLLLYVSLKMEQIGGVEPPTSAWKAVILPLNYICINTLLFRNQGLN